MNPKKAKITQALRWLAAKNDCRVEMTDDNYIEIFPLKPHHSFSGGEHSLICEDGPDAIDRLQGDSACLCHCSECCEAIQPFALQDA